MAILLTENVDSREWKQGSRPSVTLHYILDGTADDLLARNTLLASTPLSYDGLLRDEVALEPIFADTVTDTGKWQCSVRYISPGQRPPQTGDSIFSFDTAGGVQHITQSRATIASYAPAGKTAPNFQGAIGVTHDDVEGVDVTVPVYQFAETHYLPDAQVTEAYKGTLFHLTGKVNNASFRGLAAGECLFLGASGAKRGEGASGASGGDWEITFRFAGSPNVTGLTVGPITGIAKLGWEYLWVRYEDAEDEAAKALVKRPIAAYVEKVYELADFTLLGIGT